MDACFWEWGLGWGVFGYKCRLFIFLIFFSCSCHLLLYNFLSASFLILSWCHFLYNLYTAPTQSLQTPFRAGCICQNTRRCPPRRCDFLPTDEALDACYAVHTLSHPQEFIPYIYAVYICTASNSGTTRNTYSHLLLPGLAPGISSSMGRTFVRRIEVAPNLEWDADLDIKPLEQANLRPASMAQL
jgi:hypothetical protein